MNTPVLHPGDAPRQLTDDTWLIDNPDEGSRIVVDAGPCGMSFPLTLPRGLVEDLRGMS